MWYVQLSKRVGHTDIVCLTIYVGKLKAEVFTLHFQSVLLRFGNPQYVKLSSDAKLLG